MTNEKIIGYTAGAFDIFHIGHLNLIKRSKDNCDYLIVGVTTDELIKKTKKRSSVVPFSERFEIVSSIRYVDEVVVQDDLDKVLAWKKYHYNRLFSGDDWKNNPRWIGYENELRKVGVDVVYFPYTKETSSTKIQHVINNIYGDLDEIK
jgi:glycerol-3-phosphate cytidylyltransferase